MAKSWGAKAALFAALVVSAVFGPGFQAIPVLWIVNMVAALTLVQVAEYKLEFLTGFFLEVVGEWVAYMFIFGTGSLVAMSLGFGVAIVLLLSIFVGIVVRQLPKRYAIFLPERAGILLFPIAFTAVFSFLTLVSPGGSWANFAYAGIYFGSLVQISSLFGLDGINFLGAWVASLITFFFVIPRFFPSSGPGQRTEDKSDEIATDGGRAEASNLSTSNRKCHVLSFVVTLCVLFIFSGIRTLNIYGKFFQTPIEQWNQERINGVCLAGYGTYLTTFDILETTERLSKDQLFVADDFSTETADIILWSETSVNVRSKAEEEYLLEKLQNISAVSKITIGIGFLRILQSQTADGYSDQNMFALIDDGEIVMLYQKVNPVFGVEVTVQPGEEPADVIETRFGMLGAAICFDFDFPNYIRQASKGASIMLQPGWDWGPIGILHARMGALRAVENGFTLFRCSSGGMSGVYDPYGNVVLETVLGTDELSAADSTKAYTVQIPVHDKVWTLYSAIGGALGYICIALLIPLFALAIVPVRLVVRAQVLKSKLEPL